MFNKLQARLHNRKGFTLIELIVVIAIIVILIALIAPNATALITSARQTRADANAKTVYTAAQAYLTDQFANDGTEVAEGDTSLTLSQIGGFLTTDGSKLGNPTITIDGYLVTKVVVQDGDLTGTYPSDSVNTATNT